MLYINKQSSKMRADSQTSAMLTTVAGSDSYGGSTITTKFEVRTSKCKLSIMGKEFDFYDVTDFDLVSLFNVITLINTQENYWESFQKTCDEFKRTYENVGISNYRTDYEREIFDEDTRNYINETHKKWFRNEKIESLLDE